MQEGTARIIELKDHDPDALESVLRHIYGDDTISASRLSNGKYRLEMAKTACKYLFPKLVEMAMWRFKQLVEGLTDTRCMLRLSEETSVQSRVQLTHLNFSTTIEAISTVRARGDQQKHFDIADALEARHMHTLLKDDSYRAILEEDPGLMPSHLDRLDFGSDLVLVDVAVCRWCRAVGLCKAGTPVNRNGYAVRHKHGSHCDFDDFAKCMLPRHTAVEAGVDCDS